ncbi:hypothetical protein L3X38_036841 [Prunus dulcis]|uniref:Reverse transcriptase Ty1/copia-type domain-containing protein n=1 Tax=Prunus dulcis TaxID=3755 RepID=A0AAD4V3H4_PRUDU|nr:hypothetical protein L3X38_036841 [Prunus dulcis]
MDLKTAFLNGDLSEEIFMLPPEDFIEEGNDILLASSDESLLHEAKSFLSMCFEMKDLGEASYVLGIEIHRDREKGLLGLSQKAYIEKVLKRFNMLQSNGAEVPVSKGDKLSKEDCPRNDVERTEMKDKPYASVVGSIMYQSDPGIAHWKAAKKVLRYVQRTKGHMLVYKRTDSLELVGYTYSDFAGCKDTSQSTSSFVFMMGEGAVAWKSAKQPSIATSTMFVEYLRVVMKLLHMPCG